MKHFMTVLARLAVVALISSSCGDGGPVENGGGDGPADIRPEKSEAPAAQGAGVGAGAGTENQDDMTWGEPLAEPERYYGLYATEERPGREWFITEAKRPPYAERAPEIPPGHLSLGAKFGDVAPWHLRTLSETKFVQATLGPGQQEPIAIEFELDDSGRAVAFRFTGGDYQRPGRYARVGDLPEGW